MRTAMSGLKTPAATVGAIPHLPSLLPGVLTQSSMSAPPPVCGGVPSLRPGGLHHSPLEPLPLRLVSMTKRAPPPRSALTALA